MPVTHRSKEKASQLPTQGQRNGKQNVPSSLASKAPHSKPWASHSTKERERTSTQEDSDAPGTPVSNADEVEPVEPVTNTNVDDVVMLQGISLKLWLRILIQSLIAQLKAIEAELANAQKAHNEALVSLNKSKCSEKVVIIEKPPGEVGDKTKGFVLIEAMGLDGNDREREQYKAMLISLPFLHHHLHSNTVML
jgi:hypothetical protein